MHDAKCRFPKEIGTLKLNAVGGAKEGNRSLHCFTGNERWVPVQEIRAVAFYGTANLSRRAVEAVPFVQLRRLW
jgi:hypothetical protein